jgi:hypothetical protein
MAYDSRKSICKTLWKVSIFILIIIFSYESIIGGSLANALSELVEGCPKKLVNEKIPPNQLWDEVLRYSKLGFPLGAGSPSHPDGDSHITEEGIAQGHAYSIIKAV